MLLPERPLAAAHGAGSAVISGVPGRQELSREPPSSFGSVVGQPLSIRRHRGISGFEFMTRFLMTAQFGHWILEELSA